MQSFCGGWSLIRRQTLNFNTSSISQSGSARAGCSIHGLSSLSSRDSVPNGHLYLSRSFHSPLPFVKFCSQVEMLTLSNWYGTTRPRLSLCHWAAVRPCFPNRSMTTLGNSVESESASQDSSADVPPHIKFKRLDKTAGNIMQSLDKEAVEEVRAQKEIPDIKPEVPENKRRVSTIQGIVILRRNAGMNTTFRLRRQVAGVGVESLFHLYSPTIKEINVLDKKEVRRANLYYLRDRPNALKKR